jgi:phosphatidylglycerophosphatase A
MSEPTPNLPNTTTSSAAPAQEPARRRPRISLAIATAFGLGYIPKAPGTFGSLAGLALSLAPSFLMAMAALIMGGVGISLPFRADPFIFFQIWMTLIVALVGIWCADRSAKYWGIKDPQRVVVDEVSGQQLALLLGGFWPLHPSPASQAWMIQTGRKMLWSGHPLAFGSSPNWKYLLLGFILFRVFDIWKPFPARQAESLPGGLGIMADDWVAGIYAALGLWIARALGL